MKNHTNSANKYFFLFIFLWYDLVINSKKCDGGVQRWINQWVQRME